MFESDDQSTELYNLLPLVNFEQLERNMVPVPMDDNRLIQHYSLYALSMLYVETVEANAKCELIERQTNFTGSNRCIRCKVFMTRIPVDQHN